MQGGPPQRVRLVDVRLRPQERLDAFRVAGRRGGHEGLADLRGEFDEMGPRLDEQIDHLVKEGLIGLFE